jgi:xylulokinase
MVQNGRLKVNTLSDADHFYSHFTACGYNRSNHTEGLIMKRYILAYDLGTGGNKASLYDENGTCIASCFEPYETRYPEVGWHEQRPGDYWHAVVHATRRLLSEAAVDVKRIECLALSGHSLGVIPLGTGGELLREYTPIWSDTRAVSQAAEFFNRTDEDAWYDMTGNGFSRECYSIFKVMWYRDNEPEIYRATHKIIGTKDYVNYKLTGKIMTDHSYASGWGVYDLRKWTYSDTLIEASGVGRDLFPDICPSTEVLGTLTNEAADALGLPTEVGVTCGGVDNSCMALGAGNTVEGRVYLSLGSSAWIAVSSSEPVIDSGIKPFVFAHVIPGMYTSATSIFSAGNSLKWVRDALCPDVVELSRVEKKDPYDMMTAQASTSPPGSNGLLFNPSLAGGSAAHLSPHIRGGFSGLDLSHNRADIIRSVMEGITMDLKLMYDRLGTLCRLENRLLLVGGGSKSVFWRQMFADIFDTTVVKSAVDQAAGSLGAAAIAAVGSGMWKDFSPIDDLLKGEKVSKPKPSAVQAYKKILPLFERMLQNDAALAELKKK